MLLTWRKIGAAILCCGMLLGGGAPAANADAIYAFAYAGDPGPLGGSTESITGLFDVSDGTIIGIIDGVDSRFGAISGLTSYLGNDNAFSSLPPYLTINGVAFLAGAVSVSLFYFGLDYAAANSSSAPDTIGTLAVWQVPEPDPAPLLGVGAAGIAILIHRRRRRGLAGNTPGQ